MLGHKARTKPVMSPFLIRRGWYRAAAWLLPVAICEPPYALLRAFKQNAPAHTNTASPARSIGDLTHAAALHALL